MKRRPVRPEIKTTEDLQGKVKFTWLVELTVDDTWVADGFDMTNERALEMLHEQLPWAYREEIQAKVIEAPALRDIMTTQGYDEKRILEAEEKEK